MILQDRDLVIREQHIDVTVDIPFTSLRTWERGLVQVLSNLIDNALKYSPKDSEVTIRTGRTDGRAFVEVEDRGPGIPAPEQALVFEQFYRGGSAQSRGVQGAGIGLAFVKKVMEAHGGLVTLESRPGEGSAFRLVFPDAARASEPDGARNAES